MRCRNACSSVVGLRYPQPEQAKGQSDVDYGAKTVTAYGEERKRSARHLRQLKGKVAVFEAWCATNGLVYLDELNAANCKTFLTWHAKGSCGTPKTYSNLVGMMRGALNRLRRAGHITANPFIDASKGGNKDSSVHKLSFTEDESERIREAARKIDPELADVLLVAASTGLRKCDCCRLVRRMVLLDEGVLALTPAKNANPVRIPILPPLQTVLEKALRAAGPEPTAHLFPKLAELYERYPDSITDQLRAALKAVGFGDDDVRLPRGDRIRRPSVRDFASLRTSFVTTGIKNGMLDADMAKLTGHASVRLVRSIYYQPGDLHLRREMEKRLPTSLTGASAPAPTVGPAEPAGDPTQAFLDALDFCGPDDVAALKPTLRSLAAALPLQPSQRERLIKGVRLLQPTNLDAMRPRLVAAAKGHP